MQEEFDYKFVTSESHSSHFAIKLLSGTYSGVVYVYGNVNLTEEERGGEKIGKLIFSYEIDQGSEEHTKEDLQSNKDFEQHIGDVLACIISQNTFKIGHDDQEN